MIRPYPMNLIENPFPDEGVPSEYQHIIEKVLIPPDKLEAYLQFHGEQLSEKFSGVSEENPLILAPPLIGARRFARDLIQYLSIPHVLSYGFHANSYDGDESPDSIQVDYPELRSLIYQLRSLPNSPVGIVEDIVDTRRTLEYLRKAKEYRDQILVSGERAGDDVISLLTELEERRNFTSVLLEKRTDRQMYDVPVDFLGFQIPDEWVVGYGLDFRQNYRYLPLVGILRKDLRI